MFVDRDVFLGYFSKRSVHFSSSLAWCLSEEILKCSAGDTINYQNVRSFNILTPTLKFGPCKYKEIVFDLKLIVNVTNSTRILLPHPYSVR